MNDEDGLIWACELDGQGGARALSWAEVQNLRFSGPPVWIHLERTDPDAQRWLREKAGLDAVICEALLTEDTRPRCTRVGDGLLVILRGVNLNPGKNPQDMVALRMWIDASRIITLRKYPVMAGQDLREALKSGLGPRDTGEFLAQIALRLTERVGPVLEALEETIDRIEDEVATGRAHGQQSELALLRRQVIVLRRYLAPQRDVLSELQIQPVGWLDDVDRAHLREVTDRVTRYVEDLLATLERAAVTDDEIAGQVSAQMNRTTYILSLVAAIFLPLSLLTGLLGINVAGIPGDQEPSAFWVVTVSLAVLALVQIAVFRWLRWF